VGLPGAAAQGQRRRADQRWHSLPNWLSLPTVRKAGVAGGIHALFLNCETVGEVFTITMPLTGA
jgi:hypothetical protein